MKTVVEATKETFDPLEFDRLVWDTIWRWHARHIRRAQDAAHLDLEDLHQTGMAAIWERRDEFDDLTERRERGLKALKIADKAIGHMLTTNALFRGAPENRPETVAILTGRELDADGEFSTFDITLDVTPDHAEASNWNVALEALKPRTQQVLLLRQCGYTWREIGEYLGVSYVALQDDMWRDFNRHGLVDDVAAAIRAKPFMASFHRHEQAGPLRRVAETRKCQYCDGEYCRGYNESRANFAKRKFCSNSCSMKARNARSANTNSQEHAA